MPHERIVWMDTLRGFAILLVVTYHAGVLILEFFPEALPEFVLINEAVGPFRMATLMFLSGLLLPSSMRKDGATYIDGKVRQIAWPYFVWTLAYGIALLAGRASTGTPLNAGEIVLSAVQQETYTWFLFYLFCNYLVAIALRKVPRLILVAGALLLTWMAADSLLVERYFYLLAFFMFGSLVAERGILPQTNFARPWSMLVCGIFAALPVVYGFLGGHPRYDPAWAPATAGGIFFLVGLAQLMESWGGSRVLVYVGRNSLKFYVVHVVAMVPTLRVLLALTDLTVGWLIAPIVAAGLCAGWAASELSKRQVWARALFVLPSRSRATSQI